MISSSNTNTVSTVGLANCSVIVHESIYEQFPALRIVDQVDPDSRSPRNLQPTNIPTEDSLEIPLAMGDQGLNVEEGSYPIPAVDGPTTQEPLHTRPHSVISNGAPASAGKQKESSCRSSKKSSQPSNRSSNANNAARRIASSIASVPTVADKDKQVLYFVVPAEERLQCENALFAVPCGPNWVPGAVIEEACRLGVWDTGVGGVTISVERALPGFYECQSHGPGWFIKHSEADKNIHRVMLQPATTLIEMPGYRYKDTYNVTITVPPKSYRVYEPMFTKFNKNFKGAQLTESLLNAIVANSVDGVLNHPVLIETQAYYVAMMTRRYYAQINSTLPQVVIQTNGNALAKGDKGMLDLVDTSAELIDHFMPWQIVDTECELPLDWEVRNDFEVVNSRNVDFESTPNSQGVPVVVPASDFNQQPAALKQHLYPKFRSIRVKPRHRTAYFKLSGLNMSDFEEYSNSANNLTHGLKRLLGAKKDETEQRWNAIMTAAHMAREIGGLLDHLSARKIFWDLVGSRKLPSDVDFYVKSILAGKVIPNAEYAVREFVAKSYAQIWSECTRSKIDYLLDSMKTGTNWAYYSIYKQFLTKFSCLFSRQTLAEIANVKRMLRRRYVMGALLSDQEDLLVRKLDVKIKRELAKFGKAPRCFVAYDAGSVYANELPEFCKMGIDGKHYFQEGDVTLVINVMAKPRPDSLEEIFGDLHVAMSTDNHMYAAIYSDDMVIAGRFKGKSFCFNLDISSNDSSQDVPAFIGAYSCMANFHRERAFNLVKQCLLPLTVVSPEDESSFMTFKFKGPFEGSGSVLTTLLNHLGSCLIVLAIFKMLASKIDEPELITDDVINECVIRGAKLIGHTVTIDNCVSSGVVDFHHVQFLKRSPFFHGGKWRPYTNLGCILRSLGTVEDDLTCEQFSLKNHQFWALSNEQRITLFCNGIVKGWKHEPTNPILSALRERFGDEHPTILSIKKMLGTPEMGDIKHDSLVHVFTDTQDLNSFDNTNAIRERYQCTDEEIAQLARQIISLEVGHDVRSTMFTKIMCVDYGVQV